MDSQAKKFTFIGTQGFHTMLKGKASLIPYDNEE